MKILMVSPTYPPRTGGLETYVSALSEQLVSSGHSVAVLTNCDHPTQDAESVERGVRILRARGLLEGSRYDSYVPWERAFFALLSDVAEMIVAEDFDIVHCHTQVALLVVHLAGLARHLPVVASFHETNPHGDPLGLERTDFVLRSCPASLYLVGSRYFANQAQAFGVASSKIRLSYMGVNSQRSISRHSARQQLAELYGIDPSCVMISLVGRYTARKQHRRLLNAFARMQRRDEAIVVMVGSDNSVDLSYLEQLRSDAIKLRPHGVYMLENIPDEHRNLVIAGTDIGTQPSSAEGLGLAVIEFAMAGVPVLISNIEGLRETVGSESRALVQTDRIHQYAERLDELAADPDYRAQLGRSLFGIAQTKFSIGSAARRTFEVYSEALSMQQR